MNLEQIQLEAPHEMDTDGTEKMYIRVPVVKASSKGEPAYIEICITDLPADVYREICIQGAKTLINRGMSKITGNKTDASRKAVMEVAKANVEKLERGEIRMSAGVRSKQPVGAIKTEAMRQARILIKEALKAQGKKVSHYSAKDISKLATEFLESDHPAAKQTWADAETTVMSREKEKKEGIELGIDLGSIKPDPKLVAASAKKNKKPSAEGVVTQRERAATHANR